jgi:xylulokinase
VGIDGYRPGLACVYLGTGIWMSETRPPDEGRASEVPATRHLGSTTACGASVLWWCRLFGVAAEPAEIAASLSAAASLPPGSEGVLFLPHLMGERGVHANPDARGLWFGMTLAHRREHLLRAVVEGIACLIRRCLEHSGLPPERSLLLAGGAAGSALFRRAIAGVSSRAVQLPEQHEATPLGAAMLAAVGTGFFASPADVAARWVRDQPVERPNPADIAIYEEVYQRYLALEAAAEPLYGMGAAKEGTHNV